MEYEMESKLYTKNKLLDNVLQVWQQQCWAVVRSAAAVAK